MTASRVAEAQQDGAWVTTQRLVLRRPRADDLDEYVRIHSDPRTYAHAPHTMPSPERCRERLTADLEDWETLGVGYAAVVDRDSGELVGWAGLRHKDSDDAFFNLYYRLTHDRLGRGLGREISRALVAWAIEHHPDVPVIAMVDDVNSASLATARSSGLVEVGTRVSRDDPPDAKPMILFEAPSVVVAATGSTGGTGDTGSIGSTEGVAGPGPSEDQAAEEIVDLWMRVNDAGGSVGFLPGAPREAVRTALDAHLDDVQAGTAMLCLLRDPDGSLRGLGFWEHSRGFPYTHLAGLKRLMVDPAAQGRNLGRILLGGMVGIARRELPWVELLRLEYRDGLGLGDFYARAGWTEVGRVPRGLKLSETDYRDDVTMVRRVDGGPLR